MKKRYSLKGRLCFRSVFNQGKKIRKRSFTAFVLKDCSKKNSETCPNKGASGKIGIIVTKKLGKAHDRNKAKRRFKAAFYQSVNSMNIEVCTIIRLHDNFLYIDFEKLKKEIQDFLLQAGINTK